MFVHFVSEAIVDPAYTADTFRAIRGSNCGDPDFIETLAIGTPGLVTVIGTSFAFNAIRLDSALRTVGVPSLLVSVPGMGHGFVPLSSDVALRTVTCTALQFLQDRLKP